MHPRRRYISGPGMPLNRSRGDTTLRPLLPQVSNTLQDSIRTVSHDDI